MHDAHDVVFAVVVDEEIGLVFTMHSSGNLYKALSLNPTVIEITHLEAMPKLGSIWNGQTFDIPEDLLPLDPDMLLNPGVFNVFAYVANNVFVGRSIIRYDGRDADRIFAVYRSNPKFVNITDQASQIGGNPFDLIGRQIINGQIVSQ